MAESLNTHLKANKSLDNIPANRRLVDELYAYGKITHEAKKYALELLQPSNQWGLWVSKLLLIIGSALVLCGIVYFFAFNWAKLTPLIKFTSIQISIIACLLGAYFYSLNKLSGQILLLSASVLTGVFMAVFGQIYQTGADAYQLFMMWSLLILGWTIISKFAAQWIFWLAVTNIFLVLWWQQAALPDRDMKYMIYVFLTLLNGTALGLREYFLINKNMSWLHTLWMRTVLTLSVLGPMLIPIIVFVVKPSKATLSIHIAATLGFIIHGLLYFFYRHKIKDMWSLSVVVLSICIISEAVGLKILAELFDNVEFFMFLLMGLMTIGIFTTAVIYLRKTMDLIEAEHD